MTLDCIKGKCKAKLNGEHHWVSNKERSFEERKEGEETGRDRDCLLIAVAPCFWLLLLLSPWHHLLRKALASRISFMVRPQLEGLMKTLHVCSHSFICLPDSYGLWKYVWGPYGSIIHLHLNQKEWLFTGMVRRVLAVCCCILDSSTLKTTYHMKCVYCGLGSFQQKITMDTIHRFFPQSSSWVFLPPRSLTFFCPICWGWQDFSRWLYIIS